MPRRVPLTAGRWAAGAAVVGAVAACGAGDHSAPAVVVRDSAGVTIVDNGLPSATLPAWRLVDPPRLELGVDEGVPAQQFGQVVGAFRLTDGRIVVGDGISKQIRYFAADGQHLATVGGAGDGPGEFRFLMSIARLPGDTVVGSGWPIGWRAWWDESASYVENTRIGPYGNGLVGGRVLWDGSMLVDVYDKASYGNEIELFAAYGEPGAFRPVGTLLRVVRDGTRVDTIGTIYGEEFFKIGQQRPGIVVRRMPFTRSTFVSWDRDRLMVGHSDRPEFAILGYDGAQQTVVRWVADSVPVTSADRRTFRDTVLSRLRQPGRRGDFERWLTEVPYPAVKPAYDALIADGTGRVWIRRPNGTVSDHDRWLVFGRHGDLVAHAHVPRGVNLVDVGADYALTVWRNELDLEFVRLYTIVR